MNSQPTPQDNEAIDCNTHDAKAGLEFVVYNRTTALAYARSRWSRVASDNYVGTNISPFYKQVSAATVFVRTTANDPKTEVARASGQPDITLEELEDCAHFISCCIGQPPGGTAGGLAIGRDFPTAIYGKVSAKGLYEDLKAKNLITIVGTPRTTKADAATRLAGGEIAAGDLIFYYIANKPDPGHAGMYLAGADKRIACHTFCRCDQANDYNQAWDSVNGATHYTLAKIV